jgi:hypothetical protein
MAMRNASYSEYMNITEQIIKYIDSLPETNRSDIEILLKYILQLLPKSRLRFSDGKGKIGSIPNIGYGLQTIKYVY